MNPPKKLHPALAALIVIALLAIVATAAIVINGQDDGTRSTTDSMMNPGHQMAGDPATYKDGTYQAVGSYVSPGGPVKINLTVTIKDGAIVSTSLVAVEASEQARDYIQQFTDGYRPFVIGKSIDDVQLSRVAGSSLTSIGFNDALEQIKDDAAA